MFLVLGRYQPPREGRVGGGVYFQNHKDGPMREEGFIRLHEELGLSETTDGSAAATVTPEANGTLLVNFTVTTGTATGEIFEDAGGGSTAIHLLNGGVAFAAGGTYSFELPCTAGNSYALRPDGANETYIRVVFELRRHR